jgi:hypothetical protein
VINVLSKPSASARVRPRRTGDIDGMTNLVDHAQARHE